MLCFPWCCAVYIYLARRQGVYEIHTLELVCIFLCLIGSLVQAVRVPSRSIPDLSTLRLTQVALPTVENLGYSVRFSWQNLRGVLSRRFDAQADDPRHSYEDFIRSRQQVPRTWDDRPAPFTVLFMTTAHDYYTGMIRSYTAHNTSFQSARLTDACSVPA